MNFHIFYFILYFQNNKFEVLGQKWADYF